MLQFLGGLIPGFLFSLVGSYIICEILFAGTSRVYTNNARRKLLVVSTLGLFLAYVMILSIMFIIG